MNTAYEIYSVIVNKSVSKEVGISLIQNYGIRQQKEFMNKIQEEKSAYSEKIAETIKKINERLDEMMKTLKGATN